MKKKGIIFIVFLCLIACFVFTACLREDASIEVVSGIQISDDCKNLVWNKSAICDKYIVFNNGEEIGRVEDNKISLELFDEGTNNITIRAVDGNKMSSESESYIYVDKGSEGVVYTLNNTGDAYQAQFSADNTADSVAIQSIFDNKPVRSVRCDSANSFVIPDMVEEIESLYIDGDKETFVMRLPKNLKSCVFDSMSKCKGYSISSENESFAVSDGVIYTKDMKTLLDYPAYKPEKTFVFPDDTKYIGDKTFEAYYLENIDFNNALTWSANPEDVTLLSLPEVQDLTLSDAMVLPENFFVINQNLTLTKGLALPKIMVFVGQKNVIFESGRKEINTLLFSLGSKEETMDIYLPLSIEKIIYPEGADWEGVFGTFKGTMTVNIYCEAETKPEGWCENWQADCDPFWGYKIDP